MTYILMFVVLVIAELLYFKVADRFNIIDKPNQRSSHSEITLRGGGVVILFSIWLFAVSSGFEYIGFIIGATLIACISFCDDVTPVKNRVRIIFHFISLILMLCQLGLMKLDLWYVIIISLVICTYIINAYNFMDGINGITGGYSLAVLVPIALVNSKIQAVDQSLVYALILGVLVFCIFNFRTKAKCFAGDVGAVTIAFAIIFLIASLIIATNNVLWIMLLVVYGVDTVLTILHRIILKENIFKAHRKHVFQLMANELGLPHVVVSTFYMLLQFLISMGLIYLPVNKWIYSLSIIFMLCVGYIIFKRRYYYLHVQFLNSQK